MPPIPIAVHGVDAQLLHRCSLCQGLAVKPRAAELHSLPAAVCLQKFTRQGVFLAQWGSLGSGDGQFNYPKGLSVDRYGAIFVADTDNHRVVKLGPNGQQLAVWGTRGQADGQFSSPAAIEVSKDDSGEVYVADQ